MTTPYRVYIAAASVPSEIDRVERWAAKSPRELMRWADDGGRV